MLISINPCGLSRKPGDGFDWATYNNSFEQCDIPLVDLLYHIHRGDSFAGVFNGGRSIDNFVLAQHIALDFDGTASLEELVANAYVQAYAGIIYPSMSWSEEDPHYRLVFELDAPIKGADAYRLALETVHDLFPAADRACIDPARQFYGNQRIAAEELPNWYAANTLPLSDLRLLARQMLDRRRAELNRAKDRLQQASPRKRRDYSGSAKRGDLELDDLVHLLGRIDPYSMDYREWQRLGSAIAHHYGSADWVFMRFKSWSDRPGKQPLTQKMWESMARQHPTQTGYGTIMHILRQRGVAV